MLSDEFVLTVGGPGDRPVPGCRAATPGEGTRDMKRSRPPRPAVWELLDRLGMSQNELARQCGLSSGYLSQLMNGRHSPSPYARRRLQQVLGVSEFDRLFIIETAGPCGTST